MAEDEYERRYGSHPSDIDDNEWIDSLHVVGIPIKVEQVEELHSKYEVSERMCYNV